MMTASAVQTLVRIHLILYWLTLAALLGGVILGTLLLGQRRAPGRWVGGALMLVLLWAIWVLPFRPLAAVFPEAVWQRDVPFLAWTAVTVMMVYFRYGEGARDTARRWGRTLLADTHPRSPEDR